MRTLFWMVALLGALGCSRSSPAPPSPAPTAPAASAIAVVASFPEEAATSPDGVECDNGTDPHPAPVGSGGIDLSRIGGGGGPCWFSDVHGRILGDVDAATRAVGRSVCPTFDKLRDCYTAARGPQKKEHFGLIDIALTVGPDGSVTDAHAGNTTVDDARLTACAAATLRAARPGPDAKGRYVYEVTFIRRESLGVCTGR